MVRRRLRAASEHVLKTLELGRKREVLVLWRRKTGRIKAVRYVGAQCGYFTASFNVAKKTKQTLWPSNEEDLCMYVRTYELTLIPVLSMF